MIKSINQDNIENDMSISIFTSINDTIDIIDSIIVISLVNFTTSIDLSTKFESNTTIINNDETTISKFDLRFKYKQNLIYFIVDDEHERFCVSTSLKQKIFQLIHDQTYHDDFYRTYDRIASSIYIRQLSQRFRIYISHCFNCQLNQTKQYFTYDNLISIVISTISFYIVTIN